jgi:flavorubredoxin
VTQAEYILRFLRLTGPSTNMQLVLNLRIACPWKRISEITDNVGRVMIFGSKGWKYTGEQIVRKEVSVGGKKVTQYSLRRVKRGEYPADIIAELTAGKA